MPHAWTAKVVKAMKVKIVILLVACMMAALPTLVACNPAVPEEPETQTPATPPSPFSSLTPPWPDAEVFYDETVTIKVELWDKFIIAYDYYSNMLPIFKVTYDRYPNCVNLLEKGGERTSELPGGDGVALFLFQAIKEGDTQIIIKHFNHQSDAVQSQKTFNIRVVQP